LTSAVDGVVSYTTLPLYPKGKSPWYPLDRRLDESQSRSRRGGEKKNSQPLQGLEAPIIQPVALRYTADLSRLPESGGQEVNPNDLSRVIYLSFCSYIVTSANELTQFHPLNN